MSTPVLDSPLTPVADNVAMRLMDAHIPLTLLLDLAEQFGPPSVEILHNEMVVGEIPASWLPVQRA